jgi:hypothetical protein
VLDVDPRNGGDDSLAQLERELGPLPATMSVKTGGGGRHFYFHHCGGPLRTRHGFRPGLDLSAGGFVVAPPSIHASGQAYRDTSTAPIAQLPAGLVELMSDPRLSPSGVEGQTRYREGERNNGLTSIAGGLRRDGMGGAELESALQRANLERCVPPLDQGEVQKIVGSISRYPVGPDDPIGRRSQAARLVGLLDRAELFCSTDGDAYATVHEKDHLETWALRSSSLKTWLMARYFDAGHGAPSTQAIQSALGILEGKARAGGVVHPVWTRLAEKDGVIYFDLGDATRRAVAVSAQGWEVVSDPPVKFRRPAGLLPLPLPKRGGSLSALRHFIPASEDDFRLMLTWVLASMRIAGPFPILLLHGEQGSAKSSTARLLCGLLDPSVAPLRSEPKDARDLMIAATNCRVVAFDNLSRLMPWLSDRLCSLSTGAGFATRALYTDDEEKIFSAQRPVILNGIDEVACNSDLLDRALVIYLPQIPEDQRRTEKQLRIEFELALPRILGAVLDALVEGLRNLPSVRCERLPRMADFAEWGCAVAPALGWDGDSFLRAYAGNQETADDVALEGSPVAQVLLEQTESGLWPWEGTAAELLERLGRGKESATRQRAWPKNPRALANVLRRLAPNLRHVGVEVCFLPRRRTGRLIRIEKRRIPASPASPASPPELGPLPPEGWEEV